MAIPTNFRNDTVMVQYGRHVVECLPWDQWNVTATDLVLIVQPDDLVQSLTFLRDHTTSQYKILTSISAVDYPSREQRFEVNYDLLSIAYNARLRVKTYVSETTSLPSIVSVFCSADWWEREVYDMFGILFLNRDLQRILTDYGFEGHPLRKDFPVTGYVELRYDETKKRVVSDPIALSQDYREFDFQTSWTASSFQEHKIDNHFEEEK